MIIYYTINIFMTDYLSTLEATMTSGILVSRD